MRPLARRERRLVALLILLGVLGLVYLVLIAPIEHGFASRAEQRAALKLQYSSNQRQIASIPRLRRQAEKQQVDLHEFVLAAPTPAAGSAMLQERLQHTIEGLSGEVRATEDVASDDGLARGRATAQLSLDQLARLLAALQNQSPHATIEALTIAADRALISGHLEPLDVTVEISIPIARAAAR